MMQSFKPINIHQIAADSSDAVGAFGLIKLKKHSFRYLNILPFKLSYMCFGLAVLHL